MFLAFNQAPLRGETELHVSRERVLFSLTKLNATIKKWERIRVELQYSNLFLFWMGGKYDCLTSGFEWYYSNFIKSLRYHTHSDWPRRVFAWQYVKKVLTSRCFAFSMLITQAQIWKRFLSLKLNKFTLFPHSFVGWNLKNLYKQAVSIFFSLKLTF